nr:immunoglobulin light chain junction region [Mus musculus]
CLQSDEFPFTF